MNRVKSTASEAEKCGVELALPTVQELAVLATQPRFGEKTPGAALEGAFALWEGASEFLRKKAEWNRLYQECYVNPVATVLRPKKWPTGFDTFLKRVVGGDRDTVRYPRFRKFLLYELRVAAHMKLHHNSRISDISTLDRPPDESEKEAIAERFKSYREAPLDERGWDALARRYLLWWKDAFHRTKLRAGNAGVAARGEKGR